MRQEFIKDLGIDLRSIAFIEKCNAFIVLIIHDENYTADFLKGRILYTWDKYSNNGIVGFGKEIQFKYNINALTFLAEASAGLHSVTIGDSQVLAQIIKGLSNGFFDVKILIFLIN